MKKLYLIRHAKSSWDDPSLDDFDRPLNGRGKRDAPFMAELLAARKFGPDALVSSPAKRAITTARHFADAFGVERSSIIQERGIYEASAGELLDIINDFTDDWQTVLFFGHNPAFTMLANLFTTSYIGNIPTCGIVGIELSVGRWRELERGGGRVVEFHFPKQHFPG
ncbi:MAG: histidine phosphatase family protein [Saprospiraceae bacterium]|nr:histidine phosphatase family protein [Saprospiraceae bacterium]